MFGASEYVQATTAIITTPKKRKDLRKINDFLSLLKMFVVGKHVSPVLPLPSSVPFFSLSLSPPIFFVLGQPLLLVISSALSHTHTLRFYFSMFQWPGGHPQPVSEQQHRVPGGVYGVFGHEERHSVRALWTHRHLLPLLPSCQEVSHLQGSGPVEN